LLVGCGEKIAIPQPEGDFGSSKYSRRGIHQESANVRQVGIVFNTLVVMTPDSLLRRDQNFGLISSIGGLDDPRAFCVDDDGQLIVLFEKGTSRVLWYSASTLELQGFSDVPAVQDCNAMAVCDDGIEQVPGSRTFLYLSDPDSLVVHRYAFDEVGGLYPHGILCRANGDAARFVHEPAGLAQDFEGRLLVADADTSRNWVIRFEAKPDTTDITGDPDDQDPLRGLAVVFPVNSGFEPEPAEDFVLGDAPGLGESDWVGGPSSDAGEFHAPTGLAVDGSGRIFVADTMNNRIQVFEYTSVYDQLLGNPEDTPLPISIALVDMRITSSRVNYAGYLYLAFQDSNEILWLISDKQRREENLGDPDPL
jgi:hypothetical protein